ncbi:MAG: putative formate dehydrogenase alpha subunit [Candidatus Scalindua rubra]|uniref:Putative formate dehydrogenase alpha subunit n=1 Tax=Candidatus Scalindua rubra TaxID=1872076 RepID=A0A1E3X664_9BACT|nr:MAG: putative formate dehydrogenase alpha subunit [Candidatus Scalindua rubra]
MINITIDETNISVEEGTTLLEVAKLLGFTIPTLCHMDGLSSYGACRLCVVQIGEESNAKLVSSCTYPAMEGLKIKTNSSRVNRARRMILELLLASCPQSKVIQDLALEYNVNQHCFKQEYEDCILCGLCVRICEEQMMAKAIGFRGRGEERSIGTPFDIKSDVCRFCGGCMYVCPACQISGTYMELEKGVFGS